MESGKLLKDSPSTEMVISTIFPPRLTPLESGREYDDVKKVVRELFGKLDGISTDPRTIRFSVTKSTEVVPSRGTVKLPIEQII